MKIPIDKIKNINNDENRILSLFLYKKTITIYNQKLRGAYGSLIKITNHDNIGATITSIIEIFFNLIPSRQIPIK